MELAKHIEYILLEHNCVVVPGLGAFVTCEASAEWVDDESLFLPPKRTVRFNPDLQESDNLLEENICKVYQVGTMQARRILGGWVLDLRQMLLENGQCDFGSMGMFTSAEDGTPLFAPCQAGTVCPDCYGLDAFQFPLLSEAESQMSASAPIEKAGSTPTALPTVPVFAESDDKHIVLRLNRRLVHYLTATVAAVILFFLFTTQAGNTSMQTSASMEQAALYLTADVVRSMKEQQKQLTVSTPVDTQAIVSEELSQWEEELTGDTAELLETEEVHEMNTPQSESNYFVVVASAITETNANRFVESLSDKGISGARVYKKGKMVRVVFDGGLTEEEANKKAAELRNSLSELSTAWVYKIH